MADLSWSRAFRMFRGFLEGTGKSSHTLSAYGTDLKTFETFLKGDGNRKRDLGRITSQDLLGYFEWLKAEGYKTNTRRRKLMTVRRFLRFLKVRKKMEGDFSDSIPAPHKVERTPRTIEFQALWTAFDRLPQTTPLERRSRCLLLLLLETGCLVSEVGKVRAKDLGPAHVSIGTRALRTVPLNGNLCDELRRLAGEWGNAESSFLFPSFNRYGSMGVPMGSRGVELLVKGYAKRLGLPGLTPRTIRHSAILNLLRSSNDREDVRSRLGLKTQYAFRVFETLLSRSNSETTSNP